MRRWLLYFILYACFLNFLVIARVSFWMELSHFSWLTKWIRVTNPLSTVTARVTTPCPHFAQATLLCIFTTFKPLSTKLKLYNNTLHNWASLNEKCERKIRPILYTANATSDELVTTALRLGWTVLQVPRASAFGIPFIKDMYMDEARRFRDCPFYAYANGDILFDRGLIDTLQAVDKMHLNRTMVIGRRTNVECSIKHNQTYLPEEVSLMAKTGGQLFGEYAEDYFIMSAGGYPWHRVPNDVVVARRGYDNFLVLTAIRDKVSVIDATKTLLAVHQTDFDGNFAGQGSVNAEHNILQLPSFNVVEGWTSSAQYETKFVDASSITVERR